MCDCTISANMAHIRTAILATGEGAEEDLRASLAAYKMSLLLAISLPMTSLQSWASYCGGYGDRKLWNGSHLRHRPCNSAHHGELLLWA